MSTRAVTLSGPATSGSIALATVLIGFGLLAMVVPVFASLGAIKLLGWLIVFDGITQLVHAFRSEGIGRMAWKIMVGVIYIGAGLWLIFDSVLGLAGLTFMLVIFFLAEGIMDITAYFFTPRRGRSAWMLLNGAVTIILAAMIWRHWPSGSLWVVGTILGISMLMTGTTRLMMVLAARKSAETQADFGLTEKPAA